MSCIYVFKDNYITILKNIQNDKNLFQKKTETILGRRNLVK